MKHSNINWVNTPGTPVPDEFLVAVECELGIRYPADFHVMAPFIQGATPIPAEFFVTHPSIGRFGSSVGAMLSFEPHHSYYVMPLIAAHSREGVLPTGVVPFAEDGGGDLMAFDFRSDPTAPTVVYVAIGDADEEGSGRNVYPLARSFTEFLAMLEERVPHTSDPP